LGEQEHLAGEAGRKFIFLRSMDLAATYRAGIEAKKKASRTERLARHASAGSAREAATGKS